MSGCVNDSGGADGCVILRGCPIPFPSLDDRTGLVGLTRVPRGSPTTWRRSSGVIVFLPTLYYPNKKYILLRIRTSVQKWRSSSSWVEVVLP